MARLTFAKWYGNLTAVVLESGEQRASASMSTIDHKARESKSQNQKS